MVDRSSYRYLCSLLICLILGVLNLQADTINIGSQNLQRVTDWGIFTQNRPDWGNVNADIKVFPDSVAAFYNELGATALRVDIIYRTDSTDPRSAVYRGYLKDTIQAATSQGMSWYGVPWTPPTRLKTINSPNGIVGGVENRLAAGKERELAIWLAETVKWLVDQGVPPPLGVGVQNEPDFAPPYEGCILSNAQFRTAVIALRQELDARSLQDVLVVGNDGAKQTKSWAGDPRPNSGTVRMLGLESTAEGSDSYFETNAAYRNALGVIATHTYDLHNNMVNNYPQALQNYYDATHTANALTKESWMTEWEPRVEHAFDDWQTMTEMMVHFNRDMSSLGFNAWYHWQPWSGREFSDGSKDPGDCVTRMVPGSSIRFDNFDFSSVAGGNPTVKLRLGCQTPNLNFELRVGSANGALLAIASVPNTGSYLTFETVEVPVNTNNLPSGNATLYLLPKSAVTPAQNWHEMSCNWFEFSGSSRVEAENFTAKQVTASWQCEVVPAYDMHSRRYMVHETPQSSIQRRPLFYIFKRIFNHAPADGNTYVRRVTSTDPFFQGESKAASSASFRQDFSAFVNGENMTLTVVNRNTVAKELDVVGLTGGTAEIYRYVRSDAGSYNQDMAFVGARSISGGRLSDVNFPAESITLIKTSGTGSPTQPPGATAVDFFTLPSSVYPDGPFDFQVNYSSTGVGHINVIMWSDDWSQSFSTPYQHVGAGTGTLNFSVDTGGNSMMPGVVRVKAVIYNETPSGAWFSADEISANIPVASGSAPEAGITFANLPSSVSVTGPYSFDIAYSTDDVGHIGVTVWNTDWSQSAGSSFTAVSAGSGTIPITVNSTATFAPGTLRARAFYYGVAAGGSWVLLDEVNANITMEDGVTPPDSGPGTLQPGMTVSFQSVSSDLYLSSRLGTAAMRCDQMAISNETRFYLLDLGNGNVGLRGSHGEYATSNNGNHSMQCDRASASSWETFTIEEVSPGVIAIKGSNDRYVSTGGGTDPVFCNATSIGSHEQFRWVESLGDGSYSFLDWSSALPAGQRNENDDIDKDGKVNLLEYFFNTDPESFTAQDLQALPAASAVIEDDARYLVMTFRQNKDASDVSYTIESSGDLLIWTEPMDAAIAELSTADPVTGDKIIEAKIPYHENRRFLRLSVETTPPAS